jgi:hypothetical protein
MKLLFIFLSFLIYTNLNATILPPWITYVSAYSPTPVVSQSNISYNIDEFVEEHLGPVKMAGGKVIGHKVEINFMTTSYAMMNDSMFQEAFKRVIDKGYFISSLNPSLRLNLNDPYDKYNQEISEYIIRYQSGYTQKYGDTKPIDITLSWSEITPDGKTIPHTISIKGKRTTYYSPEYEKNILVTSNNGQELVRGKVEFIRHYGHESSESYKNNAIIINGKQDDNNFRLYAGHYDVVLNEPSECSGTVYENLILTPEILEEDKPIEIKVLCSYAYDANISGSIITKGDYGGVFYFDLSAKDVITHDEKEYEDYNTRGISIDKEGYPLNTKGDRVTLPMKMPLEDTNIYYTSWSEEVVENKDSFLKNNTTGDIYECSIKSGTFGFIRTYKDLDYFPGYVSKAGAYPSLDATFTCDLRMAEEIDLHIVVGPQVPLAVGGWDNMFNLTLDNENSDFLSDSQSFTEFLNKRASKAQNEFIMKMNFEGKFVRKEIRYYDEKVKDSEETNTNTSNETFETIVNPYIHTDAVYFDNSENEVNIEVFAEYDKVKTLDYLLYCKKEKKKDKLLSEGKLKFNLMM